MKKLNNHSFKFLFIILISVLIFGCSDDDDDSSSSSSTFTPIEDTPVGEVEATGFWVNVKTAIPNFVYKEGAWGDSCFIDSNSGTSQVISCMIDVNEGDLYMQGLDVQYNAPPNLCKHVAVSVPWHWNFSSGQGPKKVTVAIDKSGENDVLGTFDSTSTGCNVTLEDGTTVEACNIADEFKELNSSFEPKCIYDYSSDNVRPNCCFGEYIYEVLVDDDGDGLQDSSTTETRTWGGDVKSCLGGIGKLDWSHFNKEGYPISMVQSVQNGLNSVISASSNGTGPVVNFSFPANFYETTGTPHTHGGYVSGDTSDLPYAVAPIDDLDGSSVIPGNEAFVFSCLDEAFEVKHQISVYVREWNTTEEYLNFSSSSGVTGDPDVVGTEGVDCESIFGNSCNDFFDFKDILDGAGGAYTTDNTVANPNSIRETYFPSVNY